MTDQQLVALATQAGLCYPRCWGLDYAPDDAPEQMEHLRAFARLIIAAELEGHGQA
jgi:hypothetical protein